MGKLVVVGDVHLQDREPKKSNALDVLNWIFAQDFNNENNSILFLGDLCEVNSKYELYEVFIDYFVNKSMFKMIYLIQGNHDCINQSTILSLFRPLKNVKVITEWEIIKFHNVNLLALPFYNHESTNKKPMVELYSNLYKNEIIKSTELDYCCGHIEDQTESFSKKFCDLSNLNVKHFLHGHIHSCNIQNNGHYLGSVCMNSYSESGNRKYIANIDLETKEYELIEVPKFMEYFEVEYPNKLPKIDTKYGMFLVKNSIDKNTTIEEYTKQAKEMGFDFYARRILSKKAIENVDNSDYNEENKSLESLFKTFSNNNDLSDEISDICNNIIRVKEGKNA